MMESLCFPNVRDIYLDILKQIEFINSEEGGQN